MNKIIINTTKLERYCLGVRMRVVKRALLLMNTPPEKKYVENILSLLGENKTGKRIYLRGIVAHRDYDRLIIERAVNDLSHSRAQQTLPLEGKLKLPDCIMETKIVPVKHIETLKNLVGSRNAVYFDIDNVLSPLIIRHRKAGDTFTPFGFRGKKKLKDVFIDDKIPAYKRELIPLVVDRNDNILWIAGYRRSNMAPITEDTRKVLVIKLLPRIYRNKKKATSTPTTAPAKTSKRV